MQALFSPGNQRQFMAMTREHARERHADPG
jgi:hypothetical protein